MKRKRDAEKENIDKVMQEFINNNRDNVMYGNTGSKEVKSETSEEDKNKTSEEVKKLGSLEEKIKRSYMLKKSTIKLLDRMKLDYYDVGITLEEIVDEAIIKLYELKKRSEING